MIPEFRQCLHPWIIVVPDSDTQETLHSFHRVRNALEDLIKAKITWLEYLEILAAEGMDMDEYLNVAETNLITAGF